MRKILLFLLLVLMPFYAANSKEIAGIELPERLLWKGQPLILNGAGLVTHMFSRVFVGALYLPQRQGSAAQAIYLPGLKRIRLHILQNNLSPEDLRTLFLSSLEQSLEPSERSHVMDRLRILTADIPEIHKGDVLEIDVFPFHGVYVRLNARSLGAVEDRAVAQAVLAVWFGEKPASGVLKRAMLGEG